MAAVHPSDPMDYDDSSAGRKACPIFSGVVCYFPAALAIVAKVSKYGNDKHNGAGTPLRHTRGVSGDHGDCILRHQLDPLALDESGLRHAALVAWRALAQLQEIAERDHGWPAAPAAALPKAAESTGIELFVRSTNCSYLYELRGLPGGGFKYRAVANRHGKPHMSRPGRWFAGKERERFTPHVSK